MAQEKIIIRFQPKGDKALINAIKQLDVATKRLQGATSRYEKELKGLATQQHLVKQRVSSNTSAYNKQSSAITELQSKISVWRNKLLLLSFAMSMGGRQIAKFVQESARLEDMGRAFTSLSGGAENASIAMGKLEEATNNTMSRFDLFQQANNAMILGVTKNSDEMAEMFDVAQRLGRALGRDTRSSVESLITGIGRQSRMMLDNIGIVMNTEDAYQDYASQLNISVDSLTDVEKKQAFLNATMVAAREKVSGLAEELDSTQNKIEQVTAALDNAKPAVGRFAIEIFELDKRLPMVAGSFRILTDLLEGLPEEEQLLFTPDSFQILRNNMDDVVHLWELYINRMTSSNNVAGSVIGKIDELANSFGFGSNRLREMVAAYKEFNFEIGQTFEKEDTPIGETLETVSELSIALKLINEVYDKSLQKQLAQAEANIILVESYIALHGMTDRDAIALENLIILRDRLNKSIEETGEKTKKMTDEEIKAKNVTSQLSNEMANLVIETGKLKGLKPGVIFAKMALSGLFGGLLAPLTGGLTMALSGLFGIGHKGGLITDNGNVQRFATGGSIRGGDNVPILAQGGEFVMQRSAVQSIGIENLNRMNQGGSSAVTVNVSGNVLTQDFVEGELAGNIKEAIRRGTDFGIS